MQFNIILNQKLEQWYALFGVWKCQMSNMNFANVIAYAVCVLHWWHRVFDIDF